jgi:hypothetical protein
MPNNAKLYSELILAFMSAISDRGLILAIITELVGANVKRGRMISLYAGERTGFSSN